MNKAIAKTVLIAVALIAGMAIGQAEIAKENASKSGDPSGIPLQPISDKRVDLTLAAQAADPLALGFREPPKESRPETWFHLIGGNVAKAGLTADLESVGGAGISGIQLFHGQFGGPWPGVEPQVSCLSPQWDGMISHVANECRRLGLSFTMQNCPGWAMSGGPWITPDKAMRHLTWSRVEVAGGKRVSLMPAKPQPSSEAWRDYRDVAVIAFPTPAGDDGKNLLPASVRSNREKLPWGDLLAGKKGANVRIESGNERVWVELGFAAPVTLRSLELPALKLWSELEDQAARSFSGSATYTYELKLDTLRPDERALLDLGQVANIAEVSVNGKPAATLWTAPFRSEITSFLKPGINRIMVTVTSTWRNRLAYDAGLPEAQRKTWTISGPPADAPREEAGLKGPARLRVGRVIGFAQPARPNKQL